MRLLLFVLFLNFAAQAQPPHYFTHFTEKDGLSDNKVQCILRDQQGYLWIGTSNGLNRYDGYAFRHYFPDTRQAQRTVSNENIYDLKQDNAGYIWIATANGLNRYDPQTETFQVWRNTGRNDGSLPNSLIWNILIDQQNQLWLACDNRDLCRFNPATNTFKTYPWKHFLEQKQPQTATSDYKAIFYFREKGNAGLWFMTNFGLFSFDTANETFEAHRYPSTALKPAIPGTTGSYLHLGSWDQDLIRYEPEKRSWTRIKLPISPELIGGRRQVTHAFPVGQEDWVLSREGLFLLNRSNLRVRQVKQTPERESDMPNGLLGCYFQEKNGLIWLGGAQGLWLYDPAAQHFNYTQLNPNRDKNFYNTYSRFLDSRVDGRRYVLDFYKHELLIFEAGKQIKALLLPGVAALLFEDQNGTLWVGGGSQIFQLNRQTLQLKPFKIPAAYAPQSQTVFYDMAQDAAGNYWFGNNKSGLLVWRPEQQTWWKPAEQDSFISHSVSDLLADHSRRTIWIATQDYGLFRYDEPSGKFTLYRHEDTNPESSLGAYIVNAICKDGLGNIWAATDPGGISRFSYDAPEDKQFLTLNSENGLPSNQVITLATDATGNVWAGTLKGLAWVDARSLRVRSFGKQDGMVTDFIDLPLCVGSNGEIISGTIYGFQSFHPDSVLQEKTPPGILLNRFNVFDKAYNDSLNINYLKNVYLRWTENFFSFEFSATDFSQPSKNEYAYRLNNFDADWIYLDNRHAGSYTNVPPGNYVLEIKTGREGRWFEPAIRLGIHIAPPYWATWWFRLAALLAALGTVTVIYRWRIGQIRKAEALKTSFSQRIARTEMSALRAQMNPHFVFNCLSSINRFILVNQPDAASAYLTKFSRLIRLILDNSRTETVPLNKELEALQLYIEMEQMRFADRFEYHLEVAPEVQPEHLEIPPLLIQPYVENAIWHGLMHKKSPGLLKIRVFYEDKNLCIEVTDNGVGRQRAMELKSRSATVNKSHGMQVTAERLDVINQLYGANAQVSTEDLLNENGEAAGTRVILKISL
jgi:ligand-binding sensor domain-containing protein